MLDAQLSDIQTNFHKLVKMQNKDLGNVQTTYRIGHYFRGLHISRICAKKGFANQIFANRSRVLMWAVIQKLLFTNPNFANRGSNHEIREI